MSVSKTRPKTINNQKSSYEVPQPIGPESGRKVSELLPKSTVNQGEEINKI